MRRPLAVRETLTERPHPFALPFPSAALPPERDFLLGDSRAGTLELGANPANGGRRDMRQHVDMPHRLVRELLAEGGMGQKGEVACPEIVVRLQGPIPSFPQCRLVPVLPERPERAGVLLLQVAIQAPAFALSRSGEVNELMMELVVAHSGRGRETEPGRQAAHLFEAEARTEQTAMVDGRKLPHLAPAA